MAKGAFREGLDVLMAEEEKTCHPVTRLSFVPPWVASFGRAFRRPRAGDELHEDLTAQQGRCVCPTHTMQGPLAAGRRVGRGEELQRSPAETQGPTLTPGPRSAHSWALPSPCGGLDSRAEETSGPSRLKAF